MPAAEPRGRQQKRAGATNGLSEVAHGRVEELHAPTEQFSPASQIEPADGRLGVQGRKPVDAADRAAGCERVEACAELLGVGRALHGEHGDPSLLEAADQRRTAAAVVEHDHHTAALPQHGAGRLAEIERRTEHGGGDAAGDGRRFGVVALDEPVTRSVGHGGCRRRWQGRCLGLRGCGECGGAFVDEGDDVAQGRVVAQGEAVVAFDVVGGSDGGEGLGLFDGVDAQVGFQVQVQVEQVGGVAGLLGHDVQHPRLHLIAGRRRIWHGRQRAVSRFAGVR